MCHKFRLEFNKDEDEKVMNKIMGNPSRILERNLTAFSLDYISGRFECRFRIPQDFSEYFYKEVLSIKSFDYRTFDNSGIETQYKKFAVEQLDELIVDHDYSVTTTAELRLKGKCNDATNTEKNI